MNTCNGTGSVHLSNQIQTNFARLSMGQTEAISSLYLSINRSNFTCTTLFIHVTCSTKCFSYIYIYIDLNFFLLVLCSVYFESMVISHLFILIDEKLQERLEGMCSMTCVLTIKSVFQIINSDWLRHLSVNKRLDRKNVQKCPEADNNLFGLCFTSKNRQRLFPD